MNVDVCDLVADAMSHHWASVQILLLSNVRVRVYDAHTGPDWYPFRWNVIVCLVVVG
jgi:hypothetical protein